MARNKRNDFQQNAGGFVPASVQGRPIQLPQIEVADGPQSAGQYSRNSMNYSTQRPNGGSSRGKKIAVAVILIVLLAVVGGLGFYVFKEMQKESINQDLHSMSQEDMEAVDNELTGMTSYTEPFTMLLLGSDERSDDPGMGARTDTIILVRVDPTKNIVSMVSIPRDTMISIDGVGTQKFNAAYTYGGPSGTIAAVKNLCGIDIDHYAEINFEGLVGLIDAIGGIDVHVDSTIDDPDAGSIVIPEGDQHLDGEAALVFSRSRAYANGDYTRVSNQRKVIEAIIHKGLEAPASDLYGLVRASTGFLTTDSGIDVDFIYSLADQMRHNNDYPLTLYSATIPSATGMISGISYVFADTAGVRELMQIFMSGGDVSQPLKSSSISSDIASAGGSSSGSSSSSAETTSTYVEPTNTYVEEVDPTPSVEVPDPGYYYDDSDSGYYYDDSDSGISTGGDTGGGGEVAVTE